MRFNIKDADKAEVLVALCNAARPLIPKGMGYDHPQISLAEARRIISARGHRGLEFEFFWNCSLKIDLGPDVFDSWLYDRDNGGPDTAKNALAIVPGVVIQEL